VSWDIEDRHGLRVTKIRLPKTKSSPSGEDIYWASQSDLTDPKTALQLHFQINEPANNGSLFAWKHVKGPRPLTRSQFLKKLAPSPYCYNDTSIVW
jgi:hypothetical protein